MKIGFTYILLILSFYGISQKIEYQNDSLSIFSTLEKSKLKDIDFGNKTNGIQRHYRKINDEWTLAWITYYNNKNFLWGCKPHGYKFDFSYDLLNLNKEFLEKNTEILIPYESGKIWLKIILKDHEISSMTTYYNTGQIKEEFNQNEGYYRLYFENGKIKLLREGDFRYSNRLKRGTESRFDKNGDLKERINVDL